MLGVANVIRTVWIIKKAGLMVVLSSTPPQPLRSYPAFVHYVNLDLKASYIVHCSYQTCIVFEPNDFFPLEFQSIYMLRDTGKLSPLLFDLFALPFLMHAMN